MKTQYSLTILTCLSLGIFAANANAVEQPDAYNYAVETTPILEEEDKGFTYKFMGDNAEEGVLKLFVKDTTSQHALHDPTSDTLNNITPAAGIQVHFDF